MAIKEVGLPCDVEKLRDAFYRHHGGSRHTANVAWNRAIREKGQGPEDFEDGGGRF
jgi:hypothetical protein